MEEKKSVLVVDDEWSIREITKTFLEWEGYNVCLAASGMQMYDVLHRHAQDIHVAILDMALHDISGRLLRDFIRESHPQIKIICCTGYKLEGLEGFDAIVLKPFGADFLVGTIAKLLARTEEVSSDEFPKAS